LKKLQKKGSLWKTVITLHNLTVFSQNNIKLFTVAVKHTPTGEVHIGNKGGETGCGFNTQINSTHWVNTTERITCSKNGCK